MKTIIIIMNFKKFVKEFETHYKIDTTCSITEKYLIPNNRY